jgi:hypothetical protein
VSEREYPARPAHAHPDKLKAVASAARARRCPPGGLARRRASADADGFPWTMALPVPANSAFVLHLNDSMFWFESTPAIYVVYVQWHQAVGLIPLVLVVARIAWRSMRRW